MKRRELALTLCSMVPLSLAGCFSSNDSDDDLGDNTSEETVQSKTSTMDPEYSLAILVFNGSGNLQTGSMALKHDNKQIYQKKFGLEPDDQRGFDTGVSDTGSFELQVESNDRNATFPITVTQEAIKLGSNYQVVIDDSGITGAIQE
ncbi:hypothetical protein NDI85_10480 [Halomicroarcula sp. S1AR25-4]|uniref:hypothetical protein n=1 Tax=Haloarcula sp. S1AR25-4 TaxID=2950538 RepID=UPI0028756980|nr:hypothetical protein [Halomicroarcula sp. S1AR25-4]MDS0278222.1 hypothetical protein [Halomicroarcula sp. S1AR25-4]